MRFTGFTEMPLNIAHRGARSLAPENTLAALRRALGTGAHMWETDVQLSADGIPVLLHDDTLERTSNVREIGAFSARRPWRVRDFALEELRMLDFGSWFGPADPFRQIAGGAVTSRETAEFEGEPILTLEAALQFTRDTGFPVNVEIKPQASVAAGFSVVEKVAGMVRAMDLAERVLISSFDHACLVHVKRLCPEIATGVLVEEAPGDPVRLVRDLGADAYHPYRKAVDRETIRRLRDRGIPVNVYTVNDPSEMKALRDAGAAGIITDFPQLLRTLLGA